MTIIVKRPRYDYCRLSTSRYTKNNIDILPIPSGHFHVTCRSVSGQDQIGIKQWFFLGADQGIKTNSECLVSTHFLGY